MIHDLKIRGVYFEAIVNGEKTFEIRKDDRGYGASDLLLLREFDYREQNYTGNAVLCVVLYVFSGSEFLQKDFVCMSIRNLGTFKMNI